MAEKYDFEVLRRDDLMWPLVTYEVTLYLMKNLRLHNVSIHRHFYQNRFIYEYAKKAKIS